MPKSIEITEETADDVLKNLGLDDDGEPEQQDHHHGHHHNGDSGSYVEDFCRRHGITIKQTKQHNGNAVYVLDACVFNPEHKGKDAAITIRPDGSIGYKCWHNSCAQNGWKALRLKFEPDAYDRKSHYEHRGPDSKSNSEPPTFTQLISYQDFLKRDFRNRFLVRGVVVAGQPTVLGGPAKACKTTVGTDLCLSLASGTPFLNRFPCEQQRVAFWSGESGAGTIQETMRRIAAAKGIEDVALDVQFELPKLSRLDHITWLERTVADKGLQVLCIDPLYLCLLTQQTAQSAGNLYAMGSVLQPVADLGTRTGCTILLMHHFRKSGSADKVEPASLSMLSQSGISEWARQWILLERRTPYAMDGRHELWARFGGSAGHASLWGLNIDEGVVDPETMTGRHWEVEVLSMSDVVVDAKEAAESRRIKQAEERDIDDRRKILGAARTFPAGETQRAIRDLAGLNNQRSGHAIACLVQDGKLRQVDIAKNGRQETGYVTTGR